MVFWTKVLAVATSLGLGVSVSPGVTAAPEFRAFPQNDLHLEDSLHSLSGLSQTEASQIIDMAREVFLPVAQTWGDDELKIRLDWSDSTVNAVARRNPDRTVEIVVYGGIVRRYEMTRDAFAAVVCHELGHLYGGEPFDSLHPAARDLRIAAEGQADYYAARVCMNQLLPVVGSRSEAHSSLMGQLCESQDDGDLCLRKLRASLTTARLLARMQRAPTPQLDTPDASKAARTRTIGYPSPQCRLDTMKNGSLFKGRPACWFKAVGVSGFVR